MLAKYCMRNRIAVWLFAGISMVGALLSGCGVNQVAAPERFGPGGYEVVDYEGTVVKIQSKPKRVLTLSLTFDVIALGLTPPETLVAVNLMAADPGLSCIADEVKESKTAQETVYQKLKRRIENDAKQASHQKHRIPHERP